MPLSPCFGAWASRSRRDATGDERKRVGGKGRGDHRALGDRLDDASDVDKSVDASDASQAIVQSPVVASDVSVRVGTTAAAVRWGFARRSTLPFMGQSPFTMVIVRARLCSGWPWRWRFCPFSEGFGLIVWIF